MTDVFDQDTNKTEEKTIAPIVASPFDDKLKTIVNDQGQPKYKTVDEALEALKPSQEHIKQLEAESKLRDAEILRLRDEVKAKEALEQVVERLTNNKETVPPVTPQSTGLSEDAIEKTLNTLLSQRDAKAIAQKNMDDVANVLTTKFGEKVKEQIALKATELKMTPQQLGALSSTNPALVLSLFGEKSVPNPQLVTPSNSTPLKTPSADTELKRPEKSLLVGVHATDRNRQALMKEIKAKVYKDLEVVV